MGITVTIRTPAEGLISQGKKSVEPILRTENLWKLYRAGKVEVPALRGVNFEVQPGESVAVMGPSGGEQQRVAIARAIINEPKILLADEPTGNLDSKNSEIVLQMLRQLNKDLGQTIVMITHNPEATTYFDRVVHMRDGVIVDGVPAD